MQPWHEREGPVVVAVDGSDSGRGAVAWAIEEAEYRGVEVRVPPRAGMERFLADAQDASVIVVGSERLMAMSDLAGGSAAMEIAGHARVPVVVVRPGLPRAGPGPSAGRIVVGTDGSDGSSAAVGFAIERGRERGLGVTVVHAVEEEADRAEAAVALAEEYPEARTVVEVGAASRVLMEEASGAALLVVGSRGRGGLAGMLLGSVSQAVVHRADCPVAVVRAYGG
jgi:nucleotide-binding universal stress UspA family protein